MLSNTSLMLGDESYLLSNRNQINNQSNLKEWEEALLRCESKRQNLINHKEAFLSNQTKNPVQKSSVSL